MAVKTNRTAQCEDLLFDSMNDTNLTKTIKKDWGETQVSSSLVTLVVLFLLQIRA